MTAIKLLTIALVILLSMQRSALAQNNPLFQNGILTMPYVDTPEKIGRYKDVQLKIDENDPNHYYRWNLIGFRDSLLENRIYSDKLKVDLITTNTLPKQVFLYLEGNFTCSTIVTNVNFRIDNNVFNIDVDMENNSILSNGFTCFGATWNFQRTIALPVFGLKAGTYTYKFNGVQKGSFTLDVDNTLPGQPKDVSWDPLNDPKNISSDPIYAPW